MATLEELFAQGGTGFTGTLDPAQFQFTGTPQLGTSPFQASNYAFAPPPVSSAPFQASNYAFTPPPVYQGQAFQAPSGQAALAQDPGYQFRLAQGQRALEAGAAARGGLLSGGTQKALVDYGQQAGSQEYQNAYNRALTENTLADQRGYRANQDFYNRGLQANQLWYGRDLAANQLNYGRDVDRYGRQLQENQLWYNRDLGANQLNYGRTEGDYTRALAQNQMNYERNLGANQTWYQRALQDYLTNYNTQLGGRQQSWNELLVLANLGIGAEGKLTQGGQLYGQQAAGNITGAGAAEAAGQVGAANALSSGLAGVGGAANSYISNALLSQILANRQAGNGVYGGAVGL